MSVSYRFPVLPSRSRRCRSPGAPAHKQHFMIISLRMCACSFINLRMCACARAMCVCVCVCVLIRGIPVLAQKAVGNLCHTSHSQELSGSSICHTWSRRWNCCRLHKRRARRRCENLKHLREVGGDKCQVWCQRTSLVLPHATG